jgi:transposase-like protein
VNFRYFELYRMHADRYLLRQKVVACARTHGIKAAVRSFGCSRNTVRKWLRRQTGFGAERLKREFAIPCSIGATKRILRAHHLVRPRKKKPHTKRCLRHVKARWRLFQQLVADTKYLCDIPFYWPQMQRLRLPRFQYTVREVVSGLCLTGYADELSKSYST